MFTQLHVHSHYSLLDAIGKPVNLVEKAADLGMQALALTDYSGMYGAIDFYRACQKKDIQPIIGIEIALVQDRTQKSSQQPGTITLLAKNYDGYLNLLQLASHGNLEGFQQQPSIDRDILKQYAKHLIGFMGGSSSYIGKMVLQNEEQKKIEDTIQALQSYFLPGDFYIECIAQDESLLPQEKKINTQLLTIAKKIGIQAFCSSNVHYIEKEDKEAFEVAMAIKDGKRIYDDDKRTTKADYSLQTQEQVREILTNNGYSSEDSTTMIAITEEIREKIDITLPLGTILFPNYASDETIKNQYEKVKDSLIEK